MKPDINEFIECEICHSQIKRKNLRKHLRKIHNQVEVHLTSNQRINIINKKSVKLGSSGRIQQIFARINQGAYDTERSLVNLMNNAQNNGHQKIVKAAQQRLKKKFPSYYRRYIGPINLRDPLGSKQCYCAIPASLENIAHDIMNLSVPTEALECDACWDQDISVAWGIYGQYGAKVIDTETWRALCQLRADTKYATF